jgi:peptidoglycan/xylan/chitin deacetylase (PgdA/CDA1 family)
MTFNKSKNMTEPNQTFLQEEATAMKPHERIDFSPIITRQSLQLPGEAKVVIWPVVNIEEWDITRPMPRMASPPPGGVPPIPDVPNWTWHEYGMRVGIWRIFEAFKKYDIQATMSLNAKVCETRPLVPQTALDHGWEIMAHCYEQIPIQKIPDQRAMIAQTIEVIEKFSGNKPQGWLGPGRSETFATLDYVKEAGFRWFGDWVLDDQPQMVKTKHGPLVSVPYTVELNDIAIMLTNLQDSDAMLIRMKDSIERVLQESSQGAKILAFGVHPYITGATHRIKYFEMMLEYLRNLPGVVFWNGTQICDWYESTQKKA